MPNTYLTECLTDNEVFYCSSKSQFETFLRKKNIQTKIKDVNYEKQLAVSMDNIDSKYDRIFPGVYRRKIECLFKR